MNNIREDPDRKTPPPATLIRKQGWRDIRIQQSLAVNRNGIHNQKRRQCKPGERRQGARKSPLFITDGKTELAGSRPGRKLGQGQQIGKTLQSDPLQSRDELALEITDMGDGAAETDAAQGKETQGNSQGREHGVSEIPTPACRSKSDVEASIDKRQQPQGTDKQEPDILQERRLPAFNPVADELTDPGQDENNGGQLP